MEKGIFFYLGTEAELIKIFPLILICEERNMKYYIIASGQNNIVNSKILKNIDCNRVDLELSNESDIKKSAVGLVQWFAKTYFTAKEKINNKFSNVDFKNSYIIVHGDTVSTFMGAVLGHRLGMNICHVEAGLRSYNILNPFPEEIDRILTSKLAKFHFAPGIEAVTNLKKCKGQVFNTKYNTIIDSLNFSLNIPISKVLSDKINKQYFVFVMHRQENLADKKFVTKVVDKILNISKHIPCIIILHEITKNTFKKLDLLKTLKNNMNVTLLPRVDYFDFMKVLSNSEFVITDGGSNQEELYYMGKPCLIMRKTTERKEGLGKNAVMYNGEINSIDRFYKDYKSYKNEVIIPDISPSKLIIDSLQKIYMTEK